MAVISFVTRSVGCSATLTWIHYVKKIIKRKNYVEILFTSKNILIETDTHAHYMILPKVKIPKLTFK